MKETEVDGPGKESWSGRIKRGGERARWREGKRGSEKGGKTELVRNEVNKRE